MSSTRNTRRRTRVTVFAPQIDKLLRRHTGVDLFRLEPDTVGIAGAELMDVILRCRPATAEERPTFKPIRGRLVSRTEAPTYMQAVSADVKAALREALHNPDLSGIWPGVAHNYLRDLVFGDERFRFRILVDRKLELSPKLTWAAIVTGAALSPGRDPDVRVSKLASLVFVASMERLLNIARAAPV